MPSSLLFESLSASVHYRELRKKLDFNLRVRYWHEVDGKYIVNNFEDKLFKQQAYWVSELRFDSLIPCVYLQLVADPQTGEVECDVTFTGADEITCTKHGDSDETKNNYLCTLLGIIDTQESGKTRFIITTDTTELSFVTSIEPSIDWVNPEKPFKKWKKEIIVMDSDKKVST